MELTRRSLLGAGLAGIGLSALGIPALVTAKPTSSRKRPRNIIFCVSDGMPISVPTIADVYQQRVLGKKGYWMSLIEDPEVVTGVQDTHSLSSVVTDSAAAAAAWGSGVYHWNGQINMLADKRPLEPIGRLMKKAGMRVGLVTTTTITHATPSGFSVSIFDREWQDQIAAQHLDIGLDVLMGGGNLFFAADKRTDKRDLYAEFAAKGYTVLRDRRSLMDTTGRKLLGIFTDSHLPFTVDRDNDAMLRMKTPTLAEMTKKALAALDGSSEGFLLQVEGGRVDHGNHANDLPAAIFDQIAFEEALKVVMDFAREDGETLVVITADHACGGLALNGAGYEYFDATAGLDTLAGMKSSYAPLLVSLGLQPTPAKVRDVVEDKLGLKLSSEEAQAFRDTLDGKSPFKLASLYSSTTSSVALLLGNHSKVNFTSGNHTNDHVLLSAFGPGCEHFHGLTKNVEVYSILTGLRGIVHNNPSLDFESSKKLMQTTAVLDPSHGCCDEECPFEVYARGDLEALAAMVG